MSDVQHDLLPVSKIPASGLPAFALVCGDPQRAERISQHFEQPRLIGQNREFVSYRGLWHGHDLVVSSHGVGAPGAILMFEELVQAGVKTIIRVGTCGALVSHIEDGELVIATAAVREDGVTDQFAPAAYPAFSTPEVVLALQNAAASAGHSWYRGVIWTKALFFPGVLTPAYEAYLKAGIIGVDMELSALLVMAQIRGIAAGGLLVSDGNLITRADERYNPHRRVVAEGVDHAIEVALNAVARLASAASPD